MSTNKVALPYEQGDISGLLWSIATKSPRNDVHILILNQLVRYAVSFENEIMLQGSNSAKS